MDFRSIPEEDIIKIVREKTELSPAINHPKAPKMASPITVGTKYPETILFRTFNSFSSK